MQLSSLELDPRGCVLRKKQYQLAHCNRSMRLTVRQQLVYASKEYLCFEYLKSDYVIEGSTTPQISNHLLLKINDGSCSISRVSCPISQNVSLLPCSFCVLCETDRYSGNSKCKIYELTSIKFEEIEKRRFMQKLGWLVLTKRIKHHNQFLSHQIQYSFRWADCSVDQLRYRRQTVVVSSITGPGFENIFQSDYNEGGRLGVSVYVLLLSQVCISNCASSVLVSAWLLVFIDLGSAFAMQSNPFNESILDSEENFNSS